MSGTALVIKGEETHTHTKPRTQVLAKNPPGYERQLHFWKMNGMTLVPASVQQCVGKT